MSPPFLCSYLSGFPGRPPLNMSGAFVRLPLDSRERMYKHICSALSVILFLAKLNSQHRSMSFPSCFHDALLLVTHCNYSLVKVRHSALLARSLCGPSALLTAGRRLCARRGSEFVGGLLAVQGAGRRRQKRLGRSPQAFTHRLELRVTVSACGLDLLHSCPLAWWTACIQSHAQGLLYETVF